MLASEKEIENSFWLFFWVIVGVCIICLAIVTGWYFDTKNKLVANAKDPVAVACALNQDSKMCLVYLGSRP